MLPLKSIVWLLLILAFCACSEKKETSQHSFPKPPEEKLDSVGTWLDTDDNYFDTTFMTVFYRHFNKQMQANQVDSAAHLLYIAGSTMSMTATFDSAFVKMNVAFMQRYGKQLSDRLEMGIYLNIGNLYSNTGKFDSCIYYLQKVNNVPTDYYTLRHVANANNHLMYSSLNIGQVDTAFAAGLRALRMYEDLGDTKGQGAVYGGISCIYKYIENYQEAKIYLDKAQRLFLQTKDSSAIFTLYYNKLALYEEIGDPNFFALIDTTMAFYQMWQPKDPNYKLATYSWYATKLAQENKLTEAKKILDEIKPIFNKVSNEFYYNAYVNALSHYELKLGTGAADKTIYEKSLEALKNDERYYTLNVYLDILKEDAEIKKDYKNALKYNEQAQEAKDSLWNQDLRIKLSDLDKKYQTEKKEAQIKQQAVDAFKKNVFIAFLVLGLLAFVYFYSLLKKKNTVILQQNELNEQTITILSHDIKEPLLGVKLLLKKLNKDDPFVAQASQSLEAQINSVNGILTNLLKMKKLSFAKKDKNATANANTVVNNVIRELNVAIQSKTLTVHNELSDDVLLPIAPEKLQIIVHNLLSNAVKYSFPNQSIRIFKEGKGICIQDFGVGLSPEQRSKLMREVTASERGTNQERGNGMGLFLVGAMLQGEQLKVVFDSPEVGGTIVKVLG